MQAINPKVREFIDGLAAIDRTNPIHDPEKVIAAFKKRLEATGLSRNIRWVTYPSGVGDAPSAQPSAAWSSWAADEAAIAWAAKTPVSERIWPSWTVEAWVSCEHIDAAVRQAWLIASGLCTGSHHHAVVPANAAHNSWDVMQDVREALSYLNAKDRDRA